MTMSNLYRARPSALILALGVGAALAAVEGQPVPPTVGGEVSRLRQMVTTTEIESEAWPPLRDRLVDLLDAIADEVQAGRELSALHRLSTTRTDLLAYVSQGQAGRVGFEATWNRERSAPAAVPAVDSSGPAVMRALAEAAARRALSYFSASGPYGDATSAESGLFYLGRGRAYADFVTLCSRLGGGGTALPAPQARSLNAELAGLERRILAAYQPPRSIERHGDFIELHATLKLAQELNASGAFLGALYQYVEASIGLARIVPPPGMAERDALMTLADEFDGRFEQATLDHGIGRLFLQRAQSALAATPKDPSDADELVFAQAVLERGIPAYLEALAPAEQPPTLAPPAVTVTLVRWPYT